MNANELNMWIENSPHTEQAKVIVLLRQQQAEIEALKADNQKAYAYIARLANEMEKAQENG